jgi:lipoprotein Spr
MHICKTYFIITLLIVIFLGSFSEADAKRKRSYNRDKNRKEALYLLRSGSDDLSNLAGLTPIANDSTASAMRKQMMEATEEISSETEYEGELGEDEAELALEDDVVISLDDFKRLWLDFVDYESGSSVTIAGVSQFEIMNEIMGWLGTPYRFGGSTRKGIDCSSFTQTIYRSIANIMLPRTARSQINVGDRISRKNLQFGDLIFFNTRRRVYVSHVGIYLGDDLFAHASSRYGVYIGSLKSTYYNKRFIEGRRLTAADMKRYGIDKKKDIDN